MSDKNNEDIDKKLNNLLISVTKQTEVMTDLLLRVTSLENLLMNKNIFSKQEFKDSLTGISNQLENIIKQAMTAKESEGAS